MAKKKRSALVPVERIERFILLVRGQKVMLDRDLAELYGVDTRVLVQAVKRNIGRFPNDSIAIANRFSLFKQGPGRVSVWKTHL